MLAPGRLVFWFCCGVLACSAACGGGATSEVSSALRRGELDLALRLYDAQGGEDRASLVAIAQATLEREAAGADPRAAAQAFAALRSAGTAARATLERLSDERQPAPVRARALALLAGLGDSDARASLRAQLGSPDPDVAAAAVAGLDPTDGEDAARLRALLDSPAAAVRGAALQRLTRAPHDPETERTLARAARHDPERSLRLSALAALARQGEGARAAIEACLDDADAELRAAAAAALVSADLAEARERFAPWLAGDVTAEAIEAARALLAADEPRSGAGARRLLQRAAVHADAALRGRAAVAFLSLRDRHLQAAAAEQAAREPLRGARLCFALSLAPEQPARAAFLRDLLATRDVAALQAATELARGGDGAALALLRSAVSDRDRSLRRVAVTALGRELGRGHDVRAALRDADPGVRIAAAAAILAG